MSAVRTPMTFRMWDRHQTASVSVLLVAVLGAAGHSAVAHHTVWCSGVLGWLIAEGVLVLIAARAMSMRVIISADGVCVINAFRTRRYSRDEITRIESGLPLALGSSHPSALLCLRDGRRVDLNAMRTWSAPASRARLDAAVAQMNRCLRC